MIKRRVVVVGAAGQIAESLLPALRERYDLVLLDIRDQDTSGTPIEGIVVSDLLNRGRDTYRGHFRDADAVIHCGFVRSEGPGLEFWAEHANIQMAYNIYQTCVEEGVRRVVVTSSNHAADHYEPLILDGKCDFVSPATQARSDNYYGWAKDAYEHLGFVFATGHVAGRPLENVQIRIGGPRDTDVAACKLGDMRCVRRALAVDISQRDTVQLYVKSIETEDIQDEHGVLLLMPSTYLQRRLRRVVGESQANYAVSHGVS